jgi:hypothetical protein
MIACSHCALPTSPVALFWESFLSTRLPCVCGTLDRVYDDAVRSPQAGIILTQQDMNDRSRASDEGMPEVGQRPPLRALRAYEPGVVAAQHNAQDIMHHAKPEVAASLLITAAVMEKPKKPRPPINYKKLVEQDTRFKSWLVTPEAALQTEAVSAQTGVVLSHVFKPVRGRLFREFKAAIEPSPDYLPAPEMQGMG